MGVFCLKNLYNKHKAHISYSLKQKSKKISVMILLMTFNISFWITFKNVEKNFQPIVTALATSYAGTYATTAVNEAVKQIANSKIDYSEICNISKNENGDIKSITVDTATINLIKLKISETIIKNIEKSDSQQLGIPIGNLTNTYILSGRGPEIPVKIMTVSSPKVAVESKFESAGINQTKHKISIITNVDIQIILPYETTVKSIQSESLMCETIIVGNIPNVYISK